MSISFANSMLSSVHELSKSRRFLAPKECQECRRCAFRWIFPVFHMGNPLFLHPGKLTWNQKITYLKRKIIFQTSIFGFHVSFRGCIFIIWGGGQVAGNFDSNLSTLQLEKIQSLQPKSRVNLSEVRVFFNPRARAWRNYRIMAGQQGLNKALLRDTNG